ncbi:DinB family protein [Georgenia alba]|uniref:DinB family protein n=1 Tax=Georgenia alba TaxID=2233858 RepID=A0ABW2Q9L9_9MICO
MTDVAPAREALTWQFDMVWSLAQYHLPALTDEMCTWEPAPGAWTVRPTDDGWVADWADEEPDPVPAVTIGWVCWHIAWWWSETVARARGEEPPGRTGVRYPGSADGVRAQLTALAEQWREILADLDDAALSRPSTFPWPDERPFATTIAWAHAELMKNVAEIGLLRTVHRART